MVLLAVIAVVPLAAFELATGLPAATQTLQRVRHSLGRTERVLDAEPLVDRAARLRGRSARDLTRIARPGAALLATARPGRGCSMASTSSCRPGRRVAVVGRSGAGKSTLANVLMRLSPYQDGSVDARRGRAD